MERAGESDSASTRLLYDDAKPRLRPRTSPTLLRLRRPSWLLFPIAFVLAAGVPGLAVGEVLGQALPYERAVVGAGAASFQALCLLLALVFSRRERQSLSLLTPYYLSSVHALLALAVGTAFITGGILGHPGVPLWLDGVRLPAMDGFELKLALVYVVTFALFTGSTLASTIVFRILGLVRVPLVEDD